MRTKFVFTLLIIAVASVVTSCAQKNSTNKTNSKTNSIPVMSENAKLDTITLGGGCFWCVEAIYQRLNGVITVTSGYAGGKRANPSYEQVSSGATGHAEVVQIVFDTTVIPLAEILQVFFKVHDPTTLNLQGADEGTQYRSVVFYNSEEQKKTAEDIKNGLNKSGAFDSPIVTEIAPYSNFYKAEDYHQNYYNQNKNRNPYCSIVIVPKIEKFEAYFKDKLKK